MGELLKKLRIEHGYTQEVLGDILHVQHQRISAWEHEIYDVPLPILVKLSELYGVSTDELLAPFKSTH
ncbi:helix-turn-helix transcriptional regulator [Periweissella cryptocerci]|nr:helix-turn-helix transcriptional regulator [Periweissella cryptocerci]